MTNYGVIEKATMEDYDGTMRWEEGCCSGRLRDS